MRKSVVLLLVLLIALVACVPPEGGLTEEDVAGEWVLVTGAMMGEEVPLGNNPTTLRLDADGAVGGKTPCNSYAGTFDLVASIFDLGAEIMMTRVGCEGPDGAAEEAFFRALRLIDSAALTDDGELHLVGEEADLLFRPANG